MQKKLNYQICFKIQDNNMNAATALENKDYVKFLWVLIDKHLTRKQHIDYIASKISKIVGLIARLQHNEPLNTLLHIYRSLVFPYMYYSITVSGEAAPSDLRKILVLQKRALRLIYFCKSRSHAIPLFLSSNILPIDMLYFETVSTLVRYDISNTSAPKNIQKLFNQSSSIHKYNTRSSAMGNYYVNESRLSLQLKSLTNFGRRLWNSLHPDWRVLTKRPFKKRIRKFLFTVPGVEDA